MKIGVICPSEIAFRRFMPALEKNAAFQFVGIGVCSYEERFGSSPIDKSATDEIILSEYEKASAFTKKYGGKIFKSYQEIVESPELEAIYIPLPPALHFKWAKKALECGKHVLVEKPSTISETETRELIELASSKGLALHENYMFAFHQQLDDINKVVQSGEIGDVRLYRISFGFPRRLQNDFRYNKALGGGALLDAGGYTVRYADMLLGETAKILYAQLNYLDEFSVDMYGSAAMVNDEGVTAQLAFGMDNNYKCELEVWGSAGCLTTGRVLTAPVDFVPTAIIRKGNDDKVIELSADDAFGKSISYFLDCVLNCNVRRESYEKISRQAKMIDEFCRIANSI